MKFYNSIEEIKKANEQAGKFFFSPATMRFFNSRILDGVYKGKYFITSEKGPDNIRRYTIRAVNEDCSNIQTVGEFQQYKTAKQAKKAIAELP